MADPIQSIRYPIALDEGRGRLAVEPSFAEHVKQLIKQVLLTSPGERIHRPNFGAGLKRMVFEPNEDVTATALRARISGALERSLSSVIEVDQVDVTINESRLEVRVAYKLRAREDRQFLELEVTL